MQQGQKIIKTKKLITSKPIFIITIWVVILTVLSIWLFGLGQHRTIFTNSILSTSVLSIAFFLFLLTGLYNGIKLKDNLGKITDRYRPFKSPNFEGLAGDGSGFGLVGEGIEGCIMSIILWVVATILILLLYWLFSAVFWTVILFFIAMLYWIFFRALRLVFKNSNKCKGNLTKSLAYGIGYTILYSFWIYGIILAAHYLIK